MTIHVVIADDHPIVRDGLRLTIERNAPDFHIAGEAANGREVLKLAQRHAVDVFVLDITMPGLNGIETARRLRRKDRDCKIILLSLHSTRAFVKEALACGARGYIVKESATHDIIQGVREVHRGKFFLSPSISSYLVEGFVLGTDMKKKSPLAQLTSREREVLQLVAEGLSSKEIAEKLGIALNTVHVHRNNVMHKLKIHKETDLVRYAIREGVAKL